jgi:methyl-accepting chemotaxis protein
MASFMETAERLAELLERFDLSGIVYRLENIEAVCRTLDERLDTMNDRLQQIEEKVGGIDYSADEIRSSLEDIGNNIGYLSDAIPAIDSVVERSEREERLGWLRDAREAMARNGLLMHDIGFHKAATPEELKGLKPADEDYAF